MFRLFGYTLVLYIKSKLMPSFLCQATLALINEDYSVFNFDKISKNYTNKFIRHAPDMLTSFYGTTDVVPYWVADMDFEIAAPIQNELKRLAERARFAYEFDSKSVFQAIVNWYQRRHGLILRSDRLLQVPGVLTGISLLIRELTNEHDGILIQTPVYHQFKRLITTAGRTVTHNPLKVVDGNYTMDFEDLNNKFASGQVKAMILCNPHNPVGRVWKKSEINQVIELANQYGVTIISDEIHSDILFNNNKFNSIASYQDESHVSLIGSPAKTFGMQSISNGYIYITNESLHQKISDTIESMYLSHGNVFTTFATIAAFNHGDAWLDALLDYLESTVEWIETFVNTHIPQLKIYPVEGTYQIWLDFSSLGLTTDETKELLVEAKMGLTPGSWFGAENDHFYRMNIAAPKEIIKESFERLKSLTK